MSKLKRVSGSETIRALERLGFVQVRQRGVTFYSRSEVRPAMLAARCRFTANWQ